MEIEIHLFTNASVDRGGNDEVTNRGGNDKVLF